MASRSGGGRARPVPAPSSNRELCIRTGLCRRILRFATACTCPAPLDGPTSGMDIDYTWMGGTGYFSKVVIELHGIHSNYSFAAVRQATRRSSSAFCSAPQSLRGPATLHDSVWTALHASRQQARRPRHSNGVVAAQACNSIDAMERLHSVQHEHHCSRRAEERLDRSWQGFGVSLGQRDCLWRGGTRVTVYNGYIEIHALRPMNILLLTSTDAALNCKCMHVRTTVRLSI